MNMTVEQLRSRSRFISNELRQLNQLRRYETSGAVLTSDQSARLDNGTSLTKEFEELRLAIRTTAEEVDALMVATQL